MDHIAHAAAVTPETNEHNNSNAEGASIGSKILIMDAIMPEPGSCGNVVEAGLRVRDLTMWEVFNSGERGVGDWEGVLGRVGRAGKKGRGGREVEREKVGVGEDGEGRREFVGSVGCGC